MRQEDVYGLLRYCKALDPRSVVGLQDDDQARIAVAAWYNELPVDMTTDQAQRCIHDLAAVGQHLTAQNIGRRYDELHTPKHLQGVTRSRRPRDPAPSEAPQIEPEESVPLSGEETTRLLDELGLRNGRRSAAERVRCPHCGASSGNRCVTSSGVPLQLSPAHPARIAAAGLPVDADESAATAQMALAGA